MSGQMNKMTQETWEAMKASKSPYTSVGLWAKVEEEKVRKEESNGKKEQEEEVKDRENKGCVTVSKGKEEGINNDKSDREQEEHFMSYEEKLLFSIWNIS
jgi:hypothetical protein